MERGAIKRGDLVRLKDLGRPFFGTATTDHHPGRDELVRVSWHPEWSTWERPEALTVFNLLDLVP